MTAPPLAADAAAQPRPRPASLTDLFVSFTVLALQGFGGVLAVVQREMVEKKRWLSPDQFLEDWAVAQVLPGPNVVNLALMSLFAIQHSVMARKPFKHWWTQFIPRSVERSTYVLCTSLTLLLLFWQWRSMPAVIWPVPELEMAMVIATLSFTGWVIVFTSTFLINHFELFGLHQVANNLAGREVPAPIFRAPFFYRLVRRPIYLGLTIAFWATPTMSAGHLLFAVVTTAYIFVGIALEERDLVGMFGDEYRRYRERVSMLFPWRKLN